MRVAPSGLPEIGQTIYVLDVQKAQVLEVVVGWCGFEQDRITLWWRNKETAYWGALRLHHAEFTFAPKEEVAIRINLQTKRVWAEAAE